MFIQIKIIGIKTIPEMTRVKVIPILSAKKPTTGAIIATVIEINIFEIDPTVALILFGVRC